MKLLLLLLFSVEYIIISSSLSQSVLDCAKSDIQKLCLDQETCDFCLQAHACCSWCYDQAFTGRKCNINSQLEGCNPKKLETNSQDGFKVIKNDPFTVINGETNMEEIIQIKPQVAHLKLRKGVPVNFTFTYKPTENYPLDLYYLGDLSLSMSQNIKVFKSLGKDLPGNLTQLTKNYKLAYGSFVDKPGMPFYFTDPESYENPCHHQLLNCEKGYSFKHRLSFTKNTFDFLEKVENSQLTANVDDLDGALDAILQILNCDDVIGFSKNSRKIILLPTDSLLHLAGDGVLVGATLKPTEQCLLNDNGEHSDPLKYDYPSLEQIEMLLRQKKVNIIFAVKTETKLYYYMNMTTDSLKGFAYVAELEEESKNILDLIRSGYYSFAEQVSFSINKTQHENFDIKFFGDCENLNIFNETSICYHVKNEPVTFKVQITLKEVPLGVSNDTLYIEEKALNDKIQLFVEYLGTCKCHNYEYESGNVCINGDHRCGQCVCENGWTGKTCAEECSDSDLTDCRSYNKDGVPSRLCHGNGECDCGLCVCDPSFTGKYCEYACPSKRSNGELIICGGPSKGKCFEGKCICENGFAGEDCSCSTSQHDCAFDGTNICSGQGQCVCNECKCDGSFNGKFCEKNGENNTICDNYEQIVKDSLLKNDKKDILKNDRKIRVIEENQDKFSCDDDEPSCRTTIFESNSHCVLQYCYHQGEDDTINFPTRKYCTMTAGIKASILAGCIVAAILVLGLLGIISYKMKIYKQDKIEYEKFIAEQKLGSEMNPIYRSPVTQYNNPLRTKSD